MADEPNVFNEYFIEEVVAGDFIFRSDQIRGIEVPTKALPAWKITFFDGEKESVMFVTGQPLTITGVKIVKETGDEEEIPSEDE